MARKDLLTRLADAGEEAVNRLQEAPGADRLVGVANTMRDRVDELQKKVRGIDEMERRIAVLEKRVDELAAAKPKRTPARRATTASRVRKPRGSSSSGSTERAGGESPG